MRNLIPIFLLLSGLSQGFDMCHHPPDDDDDTSPPVTPTAMPSLTPVPTTTPEPTGEPTMTPEPSMPPGDDDDATCLTDNDRDGYLSDVDCNDRDANIHPGALELCNAKDDNCDGIVDNADADGDGYNPCDTDASNLQDCNDQDPDVHPGALEVCNGIDDDCDAAADEGIDADNDGDGYSTCQGDCKDDDPTQYPLISDSGWIEYLCNPVIANTPGADSKYTDQASVLIDPEARASERYKAWYRYGDESDTTLLAYATSPDGTSWTKHGVVLNLGQYGKFDDLKLNYPTVLTHDGRYYMWYHGLGNATLQLQIGFASSDDGATWERENSGYPVFSALPGSWDSRAVQAPSVQWQPTDDGKDFYYLWYGGTNEATTLIQIGLAISTDGVNWARKDGDPSTPDALDPVLTLGPTGAWDSKRVNFPRVTRGDGGFEMFYSGLSDVPNLSFQIGYASSPEGLTWTKFPENPVIDATAAPAWRAGLVYSGATVITTDSSGRSLYQMFFSGGASTAGPFQTGLATNYQPQVMLETPTSSASYTAGQTVNVQGHVDEPYFVTDVEVMLESDLDGMLGVAYPAADGTVAFSTTLSNGTHTLSLVAQDAGGLRSRDQVTVYVSP